MKRFSLIINGDSRYIYDSKKDVVYSVDDTDSVSKLRISLEQLSRFCPYSQVKEEFDEDIYHLDS